MSAKCGGQTMYIHQAANKQQVTMATVVTTTKPARVWYIPSGAIHDTPTRDGAVALAGIYNDATAATTTITAVPVFQSREYDVTVRSK